MTLESNILYTMLVSSITRNCWKKIFFSIVLQYYTSFFLFALNLQYNHIEKVENVEF